MEKRKPTGYVALPASDYSQLDTSEADPLSRPPEITALQPLPPANHDDLDDDRNRTVTAEHQQINNVVVAAAQPFNTMQFTRRKPPNYLVLSLINLLCCCFPLGIVGLIFSIKVNTEFAAGRYEEAKRASDIAKNINYVALGIGVCLFFLYIGIITYHVISVLNTSAQNDY